MIIQDEISQLIIVKLIESMRDYLVNIHNLNLPFNKLKLFCPGTIDHYIKSYVSRFILRYQHSIYMIPYCFSLREAALFSNTMQLVSLSSYLML